MSKGYKKATVKQPVKNHENERTKLIPKDAQIQNTKSARVYVFGDEDVDEDEVYNEELELPTMRSRGKTSPGESEKKKESAQMEILERPILDGDTLQSIALKYRVPVRSYL